MDDNHPRDGGHEPEKAAYDPPPGQPKTKPSPRLRKRLFLIVFERTLPDAPRSMKTT
jgi:hypothetical protein